MRFAVLTLLILYGDVSLVTAQTLGTGAAISAQVNPVQEDSVMARHGGTARGFLGVGRLVRNGSPGVTATKDIVVPAVEFDPPPDFPDLRAAIDVAVAVELQAAAAEIAKGDAGEVPGDSRTGFLDTLNELFAPKALVGDFVHIATSKDTLLVLGTGLAAGGLINMSGGDDATADFFAADEQLPPGVAGTLDTIGASHIVYPAAIGTYFLGRALGNEGVRSTGAKLTQGLLVSGVLVTITKRLTSRTRPDDGSLSFPSGHTADCFTIATILQLEHGWKLGVPAYAVAGLVSAQRLDANRHFLSDVIVGAAIGLVVGHTVSGRMERNGIQVGVVSSPDGGVGVGIAMDLGAAAGYFGAH